MLDDQRMIPYTFASVVDKDFFCNNSQKGELKNNHHPFQQQEAEGKVPAKRSFFFFSLFVKPRHANRVFE